MFFVLIKITLKSFFGQNVPFKSDDVLQKNSFHLVAALHCKIPLHVPFHEQQSEIIKICKSEIDLHVIKYPRV
jgi:hypothetical protein